MADELGSKRDVQGPQKSVDLGLSSISNQRAQCLHLRGQWLVMGILTDWGV